MTADSALFDRASRDWSPSLRSRIRPDQFHYTESLGSTNDHLLGLAKEASTHPFTISLTEHQTAGRGRRGDSWVAPAGKNLLFSILLDLSSPPERWSRLPHLIAWALGRAVESLAGNGVRIQTKWPNDLYLSGRKLAGILVETNIQPVPRAVVGVGINVNMHPDEFPAELRETAISLYEIVGCESSRWYLLSLFLENLIRAYPGSMEHFDECLAWMSERDFLRGRNLSVETAGKTIQGTAAGITSDGALLLETEQSELARIISCDSLGFC